MVFFKGEEEDTLLEPTPEKLEAFKAMDDFTEELVKAGVFVAAAGLKPSKDSKRITFKDGKRTVTDGPFTETREMIAGFSIWEVRDMDEALAWVERCPMVSGAPGALELRPFYEAADLADFVTPEELENPRTGERGKLGVA
jgi:hypothetical protein